MTTVATANILYKLGWRDARTALRQMLEEEPDLIGLQEWYPTRIGMLRETGTVRTVPGVDLPFSLLRRRAPKMHWVSSLACGNVVGARADRFDLTQARAVVLSGIGRSDRPDRFLSTEPPRLVTIGVFADRQIDLTIAIMSYHLAPGVERNAQYIEDRPLLKARHLQEVGRLEKLIAEYQRAGHVVYAVGDSNFDSLRLAGLTSAWEGRGDAPGTIGSRTRKLDDVHGPGPATAVKLVETPSDHRAVVAVRPD
jgi:endonuclease/exonuclease/phosphatase family metal-dependent hydrolase